MRVADYKDLRVYKLAVESAVEIYELSKGFPREEKYALTDQVRRSSRSICANIAEAWRKRRYEAAFVSKLSDADAEAAETEVWLNFALQHSYLTREKYCLLSDHYDHICRQLRTMIEDASSWCATTARVRESHSDYFVAPRSDIPRS